MENAVNIGGKMIGEGHPVFVIAEIGINHNGSLETVKKLIDMSVESGCDAVKFQKRTIEVVYTPEELAKPRESVYGATNGDLKHALEFGEREYKEIDRYCKEKGILWFASCWDEGSVDFIEQFDPVAYKVASASLTDAGLLKRKRATGKPIIISTGMSTMEQIEKAVELLGEENLVILHTTSTYPSENEELNLLMLKTLKAKYPTIPVGYSGHERGVSPSLCAVVLGASVIERHVTLDRTMWGSDQAASLEPRGVSLLVRDIRMFEVAKGDGVKRVYESEVPIQKKLRRVDSL